MQKLVKIALHSAALSLPRIKKFFDDTTLWVVPVVNPDGYQYSWSTSRYWRKNRRGKHGDQDARTEAVDHHQPSWNQRTTDAEGLRSLAMDQCRLTSSGSSSVRSVMR